MGNRCLITTKENFENDGIAVYLHWNGGRDSVEPFLKYCKLKGYRPPELDGYGWARLCQVIGNFFGGTLSLGIDNYTKESGEWQDNGTYIIKDWEIVDRKYYDYEEQDNYDFDEMLVEIDKAQPRKEQLGDFIKSKEVPVSEIKIGDEVYMMTAFESYELFEVVGIGEDKVINGTNVKGIPYIALYEKDGKYDWNINNYLTNETVKKL